MDKIECSLELDYMDCGNYDLFVFCSSRFLLNRHDDKAFVCVGADRIRLLDDDAKAIRGLACKMMSVKLVVSGDTM